MNEPARPWIDEYFEERGNWGGRAAHLAHLEQQGYDLDRPGVWAVLSTVGWGDSPGDLHEMLDALAVCQGRWGRL